MMQKVIPQAMPMSAHAGPIAGMAPGGIQVGYGHPIAMPQKAITVQAGPAMGYGGYGQDMGMMMGVAPPQMAMDASPVPTAKALTLGATAFGANALSKNMVYGPGPVGPGGPVLAQGPMLAMDKGLGAGPYAGFSVGLAAGGKDMSSASFAHGPAPMSHAPVYAPGPLGTFSPEKASLASLPGKGFVAGQPIEMITAQKTFFAGPGHAVGYANGHGLALAGGHVDAGHAQAMAAAPVAAAVTAPAGHASGYGPEFAFAEKIFASAPAGLYGKPYATSPLATKSMMIK